jgi:hypothetical protein
MKNSQQNFFIPTPKNLMNSSNHDQINTSHRSDEISKEPKDRSRNDPEEQKKSEL